MQDHVISFGVGPALMDCHDIRKGGQHPPGVVSALLHPPHPALDIPSGSAFDLT
jgi:hypothetical protein